jgi:lipoprotein NlpI
MLNDLINGFRLQAGISRLDNDPRLVVIDKQGNIIDPLIGLEKFARLIVEQCVTICEDMDGVDNFEQMIHPRTPRYDCAVEIREHFGFYDE